MTGFTFYVHVNNVHSYAISKQRSVEHFVDITFVLICQVIDCCAA